MFLEPRNSMIQRFCILCVSIKSNGFVFYVSISKANHQVSFCTCTCVPVCMILSLLMCLRLSPLFECLSEDWPMKRNTETYQYEPGGHSSLACSHNQPQTPYKYTTVSTSWGMQHNSVISLESFLFHTLLTQDSQSVQMDLDENEGKAITWKAGGRNKWFEWVIGKWQQWQNKVP